MFAFEAPPPLSLYVHFPWCVRKCPYCDFNSHPLRDDLPEQAYVDALLADLEQELPSVWGRTVHSVFLGGGTPSLFTAAAIERLLAGIRARLPLRPDAEITLEANPGTAEQARFAAYREAGVNRLSIGIQSLDDARLRALGRIHDAAEARRAVAAARRAGFDNLNLDLMFGLPQQDVSAALAELRAALELQPEHLSWYQLTLEPNTLFHARPPPLPDDEQKWAMQQQGLQLLEQQGYEQYEVSAFARQGRRCAHNLNYWRYGDYIGIGAGAHGKITLAGEGTIVRSARRRHPADYLAGAGTPAGIESRRRPGAEETAFEYALNRLRLRAGFDLEEFETRCGLQRRHILPAIEAAAGKGLLRLQGERVEHSERGWRFLDDLLQEFLPRSLSE